MLVNITIDKRLSEEDLPTRCGFLVAHDAHLDGERNHLEADDAGALECLGDFVVTNNNSNVVEQIVLRVLHLGRGGHEAHGVSSGDIAQLVVAHRHREVVQQPVHAIFLVNHVLKHFDVLLLVNLLAKHHAGLVLLHVELLGLNEVT